MRFFRSLLIMTVITAVICESLVYLMLEHPGMTPEPLRTMCLKYHLRTDRDLVQYLPECAQWDPDLFYILRPGGCHLDSREFEFDVSVNELGLRDREFPEGPEIMALGDSEGFGWGVEQDQTYAKVLETQVDRTVLNGGVPSYGTAREMILLKRMDRSNLQAVVIVYNVNDYEENVSFLEGGGNLEISGQERWEAIVEEHAEVNAYYPGKHIYSVLKIAWTMFGEDAVRQEQTRAATHGAEAEGGGEAMAATNDDAPISEAEAFVQVLSYFPELLEDKVLVVCEVNERAKHNDSTFVDEVAALMEQDRGPAGLRELVVLDMSQYLTDEHFYIMDGHMNAAGHQLVGETLARALSGVL
ncbi:MAG: hypothetical protein D6E12_11355 [Desulfovibrio sp.]|nr:MAG: hypothetical protein D6E12_11355 [Desulfovibrio sp.]